MNIKENFIQNVVDIEQTISFWKDKITALRQASGPELTDADRAYINKIKKLETKEPELIRLALHSELCQYVNSLSSLGFSLTDPGNVILKHNVDTDQRDRYLLENTDITKDIVIGGPDVLNESRVSMFLFKTQKDYLEKSAPIIIRAGLIDGVQSKFITSKGESLAVKLNGNSELLVIAIVSMPSGEKIPLVYEDFKGFNHPNFIDKDMTITYSRGSRTDPNISLDNYNNGELKYKNNIGGYTAVAIPNRNIYFQPGVSGVYRGLERYSEGNSTHGVLTPPISSLAPTEFDALLKDTSVGSVSFEVDTLKAVITDAGGAVKSTATITGLAGFVVEWATVLDFDLTVNGNIVIGFKATMLGQSFYAISVLAQTGTTSIDQIPLTNKILTTDSNTGFYIYSEDVKIIRAQTSDNTSMESLVYTTTTSVISKTTDVPELPGELSDCSKMVVVRASSSDLNMPDPTLYSPVAYKNYAGITIKSNGNVNLHQPLDVDSTATIKGVIFKSDSIAYVIHEGDWLMSNIHYNGSFNVKNIVLAGIKDFHFRYYDDVVILTALTSTEIYRYAKNPRTGEIICHERKDSHMAIGILEGEERYASVSEANLYLYDDTGTIVANTVSKNDDGNIAAIYEGMYEGSII